MAVNIQIHNLQPMKTQGKEIDCLQHKALWTKPVHKTLNFILLIRWREINLILNCKS